MSTTEFFAARLAAEVPAFNRVIRALPGDQLHYRPHEKNTTAGTLAWQLAQEMKGLATLFQSGDIRMGPSDAPRSIDEIAAEFEKNANDALHASKNVSEERWNGPAKFYYADQLAWEEKASEMAWGFLLDMIHHRGQLSAYLRPMGGKVPSIYGPSADDKE